MMSSYHMVIIHLKIIEMQVSAASKYRYLINNCAQVFIPTLHYTRIDMH